MDKIQNQQGGEDLDYLKGKEIAAPAVIDPA